MAMNDILYERARHELLREAVKYKSHICKLKNGVGGFVKIKHRYMDPDEMRVAYLEALEALVAEGVVRPVFSNKHMDLYELSNDNCAVATLCDAKQIILKALTESGHIYKIHSDQGEYVQGGQISYDRSEDERILFLAALYDLVHHGTVQVAEETRELAIIEFCPRQDYVNCDPVSKVRFA